MNIVLFLVSHHKHSFHNYVQSFFKPGKPNYYCYNFKFKLESSEATTSTISYISLICHFCQAHLLNVINIIFDFGSIFTKAFSSAQQWPLQIWVIFIIQKNLYQSLKFQSICPTAQIWRDHCWALSKAIMWMAQNQKLFWSH